MKHDVLLCEPFILPGILPTLGTPTLKAALAGYDLSVKCLYPSLTYFIKYAIYRHPILLNAIEDIPLQFSEFLFCKKEEAVYEDVFARLGIDGEEQDAQRALVKQAREQAENILAECCAAICAAQPRVLVYSLTFGDYNFAFSLLRLVKQRLPQITVVVGGSSCTPCFARELLARSPDIDFVVCDEGIKAFQELMEVFFLRPERSLQSEYICSRTQPARAVRRLQDLNELPCPDFGDFITAASELGLRAEKLMIPYEMARGCWWGAKHPCKMCGYFGNQRTYIKKDPGKILADLRGLKAQGLRRIRFTDLVAPTRDVLAQLMPLGELDLELFIEFRPNLRREDIEAWKRIGVHFCQIGFESLCTEELRAINKGTTAIQNLYVLKCLYTFRIQADWNYLFGFSFDRAEWYLPVIHLMPLLYHLQPPAARRVWINKSSVLYEQTPEAERHPIMPDYHDGKDGGMEVFFAAKTPPAMESVYTSLQTAIGQWRQAFFAGAKLQVERVDATGVYILRDYGSPERFCLCGEEASLYLYLFQPHTLAQIRENLSADFDAAGTLDRLMQQRLLIFLDGYYMALATLPTKYRWRVLKLFDVETGRNDG